MSERGRSIAGLSWSTLSKTVPTGLEVLCELELADVYNFSMVLDIPYVVWHFGLIMREKHVYYIFTEVHIQLYARPLIHNVVFTPVPCGSEI
jgi:hypothetical protein